MYYLFGILMFVIIMMLSLVFYKYVYRVCERLGIKINKIILCVISIVIFYGSLVIGMMNKYVSVLLIFILYLILSYMVVLILNKFLFKYERYKKVYLFIPAIVSLISVVYGIYNIYDVRMKSYDVSDNGKLSNNYKAVLITDLHYGLAIKGEGLQKKIDEINELNPDMVFLVGDIVDESTTLEGMKECFHILGKLKTTYGIFYSYGNHDENIYSREKNYSKKTLAEVIHSNGINILEDDTYRINDELTIIGRSNGYKTSISDLVSNVNSDDYKMVLAHIPEDYKSLKDNNIDLVLSGHTHAGQIFPAKLIEELFKMSDMIYGYEVDGTFNKVVTSGIAGWGIPIRTDEHSEYVVLNIK